jgi:hypothetical protein
MTQKSGSSGTFSGGGRRKSTSVLEIYDVPPALLETRELLIEVQRSVPDPRLKTAEERLSAMIVAVGKVDLSTFDPATALLGG